jgi:hypothetical protein
MGPLGRKIKCLVLTLARLHSYVRKVGYSIPCLRKDLAHVPHVPKRCHQDLPPALFYAIMGWQRIGVYCVR